ncbi:hypothetical protein OUZ56_003475 [Daphnia magna]|uniref:Uncharacterized protein n=1 Tax=Daphnia magna TaxID=35525 RepID=A0ABR0A8W6_9CRUS|nr:hypothetical protein OUZ56_003475 [Daphnia magna]
MQFTKKFKIEDTEAHMTESSVLLLTRIPVGNLDDTITFFVTEDQGDNLYELSHKEIKIAKQVIAETFRPTHSIDEHAGTIFNSGGYRLDLQGYVKNCGTKWANVQLQYGVRRPGSSNTFAQVLIPAEDQVDYSHNVRLKALFLSLEHRVAVWVRTVPASADELKGPSVRDDFLKK